MTTDAERKAIIDALYEIAGDGITGEQQREWRQEKAGEIYRFILQQGTELQQAHDQIRRISSLAEDRAKELSSLQGAVEKERERILGELERLKLGQNNFDPLDLGVTADDIKRVVRNDIITP